MNAHSLIIGTGAVRERDHKPGNRISVDDRQQIPALGLKSSKSIPTYIRTTPREEPGAMQADLTYILYDIEKLRMRVVPFEYFVACHGDHKQDQDHPAGKKQTLFAAYTLAKAVVPKEVALCLKHDETTATTKHRWSDHNSSPASALCCHQPLTAGLLFQQCIANWHTVNTFGQLLSKV